MKFCDHRLGLLAFSIHIIRYNCIAHSVHVAIATLTKCQVHELNYIETNLLRQKQLFTFYTLAFTSTVRATFMHSNALFIGVQKSKMLRLHVIALQQSLMSSYMPSQISCIEMQYGSNRRTVSASSPNFQNTLLSTTKLNYY